MKRIFWMPIAVFAIACGSGDDTGNNGNNANNGNNGKGDDSGKLVGDVSNGSGRDVDFTQLQDPIAKHVLRSGDSIPGNFEELVEKLREFDNEGNCEGAEDNPGTGMTTFAVSETAQILDQPSSYRTVTHRRCGEEPNHSTFFSLFGVAAGDTAMPPNVEIISFDSAANVYNYYEISRGEFEFFGDSNDLDNGSSARCTNCHVNGQLVMKELDTPWLHWEGHLDTPGVDELLDAHGDLLGRHGTSAASLESIVKAGDRRLNEQRIVAKIAEQDVKTILRPLFCSDSVNLDNGADFKDTPIRRVNGDLLFDGRFFGRSVSVSDAAYEEAIANAGQTVEGTGQSGLTDTVFKMVYPERAHIDMNYVDQLEDAGVVDDNFIEDVLMVNFTRPIFDDARCELLEFAPDVNELADCCKTCATSQACGDSCISADANCSQPTGCACGSNGPLTPGRIRDGFIAKLEAAESRSPAAQALLDHLTNPDDSTDHENRRTAFTDACSARDEAEFMADVTMYISSLRNAARELHMFEFPATMPFDTLNAPANAKLNETTCELE